MWKHEEEDDVVHDKDEDKGKDEQPVSFLNPIQRSVKFPGCEFGPWRVEHRDR